MIAPMKKYSFWVFHKAYDEFLHELRRVGLVHVQEKGAAEDEKLNSQLKLLRRYNMAIKALDKLEVKGDSTLPAAEALDVFEEKTQCIEQAKVEKQKAEKELRQINVWGDFDRERILALKKDGVFLHLFTSTKFDEEWEQDYAVFHINEISSKKYFALVSDSETAPELEAENVPLPRHSLLEIENRLKQLDADIEANHQALEDLKGALPALKTAAKNMADEVQLTKVKLYTENIAEGKAMLIEGFAPTEKEGQLESMLKAQGIFYTSQAANVEDDVPILLKNNRFNRLFEVVSDLYARPRYNEFDLTPFFGIFYMIFFGFCLGDAGYGMLFMLLVSYFKGKAASSTKPYFTLAQFLSLSTILFGLAGGTFFGIELYKTQLPVYRDLAASMSTMEGDFVSDPLQDIMLKASLALGLVQILLGIILNGIRLTKQKGIMWGLSKFAWAGLFISSLTNVFFKEADAAFLNPTYSIAALACLFVILFLNTPNKNPFINLGSGLWDAYNMLVGGLGDLLSYLRLFALGLASSILGLVFNQLGATVLSDGNIMMQVLTVIVMLIILLIGHGINIFMSTLSATVHPLRLVFVEFYKNAGFEGGGKKFKPFKVSSEP